MIERLTRALEGRYEIQRELGEGGMATVFLAEDLRHHRKVAIKVLKPELAAVVGADRFLSEIETTANLQHPHILPLFDSGEADGFLFYVMPFVEGESLRERLEREKQLPVEEAVSIAVKVAGALEAAHEQGVVHRDVKPANILLSRGEPLVSDFGIALAVQQAGGGRLTETGMSLGTPYYMSPEQATGDRAVDARSDVYSLGCVVYEMLTGEPPYTGSTAQAVLGRILTGEAPRPSAVRKNVPAHVEAAVLHALEKLPADRPESAERFARELTGEMEVVRGVGRGSGRGRDRARTPFGAPAAWLAAAALAAILLGVAVGWMAGRVGGVGDAPSLRATLELPDSAWLFDLPIAISPDGRTLVVEAWEGGEPVLMRRRLDALGFERIPGTEGGQNPSFSPEGRWLLFTAGDALRRIPVEGGGAATVATDVDWGGGSWGEDGTIYYTPSYSSGLWRADAGGGPPQRVTEPDTAAGELGHWWPQVLPGGDRVLFTAMRTPIENAGLSVLDLESGERTEVLRGGVSGRWVATGHLLYATGEVLFAVPFDLDRMETTGQAVPLLEGIAMAHTEGLAGFDLAPDGTLVYVSAEEYGSPADPVWVDRAGSETPIRGESGRYHDVSLSPEGGRIAFSLSEGGRPPDVWVQDLRRGTRTQITSGGGAEFGPLWSPDGEHLVFSSERPSFDVYRRPADGSRRAESVVRSPIDKYPSTFTPDGDTLVYISSGYPASSVERIAWDDGGRGDPLDLPGEWIRWVRISPDGRWLAYVSAESGRDEVYLVPYRGGTGGRRIVSTEGGGEPLWTRDGREIVFRDGPEVLAVALDPATGELGRPEVLFEGSWVHSGFQGLPAWDAAPDGERFVMLRRPFERLPRRIVVVTDFLREIEEAFEGGP